ncbi:hypothetical protein QQ020_24420 [Fulvivirgaceae bacterium BMA12]|uniref:Alpha-galactosidase n=1 Tax=Agaribacillus aureus TaxID=3051825 RepID=A0ABT8LDT1_9BACT|nr:hypothetical protein [Fulvivirgaceae bacterium BMA12]
MKIKLTMRNGVNHLLTGIFVMLLMASCAPKGFEIKLDEKFKEARAFTKEDKLTVTTGRITRHWQLTKSGLITQSVTNLESAPTTYQSDWNLTGILPEGAKGKLVALSAKKSNDEGFTTDHLEVTAEFEYPKEGVGVKYLVWAFPNAPGLRTQLFVRKLANYQASSDTVSQARAEYLPVKTEDLETRLIGYYNHTQRRNNREDEILKEEMANGDAAYDWPSVIDIKPGESGLMLVQESHKCVNQAGVNTGAYHVDPSGVSASGLGIGAENLTDQYRPLWAYWLVAYEGEDDKRQLALKQFDRIRYPIDPKRDIYIMANSWGSGAEKDESLYASREANILAEIQSQKDLGIDLQQVDDGWQGTQYNTWDVVAKTTSKTFGEYDVYPEGWKNIKAAAAQEGLRLGLWAAWKIPGEDLLKHYETGGFTAYKLDFANLKDYETFHGFINKIRHFILATGHEVRVNWDVTENPARIGYYFGREYGNIYLENRKPIQPAHVVYRPYLVLRDAWQVAKYTNLNKFQVSIQNIDRVNKEESDAYLHNHPYSVAIALMGSPIFFQETHYYDDKARDQIKEVIRVYKQHRDAMYNGYVFPIGQKPDNASWTGFQNYNPETSTGYLTIFREINNEETTQSLKLYFLKTASVKLTNLMTGEVEEKSIDESGNIVFEIAKTADFRFYKYEII